MRGILCIFNLEWPSYRCREWFSLGPLRCLKRLVELKNALDLGVLVIIFSIVLGQERLLRFLTL